ncbi:uncharacterized protein LOC131209772 [Anopheles bellator]|uniref:uncharacterized protein LOC131209772 n=1 Tax=Anopheles bellator TaxID=139047 RepID=UPI002649D631|nr:uncharacterized protein LOC131209772 [Anopheles bellator]
MSQNIGLQEANPEPGRMEEALTQSPAVDPALNKYQQVLDGAMERLEGDTDTKQSEGTASNQKGTKAGSLMPLAEMETDEIQSVEPTETDPKRKLLRTWLNSMFRIKMTDGRILIGFFVCTDAEANVVLQVTSEYTEIGGEERYLGLVMIPGRYIVSIEERNDVGKSWWS